MSMNSEQALLTVRHLRVQIKNGDEIITPVDPVNFTLQRGEVFAIVGESGCGKTMTALAINRLLPTQARLLQDTEIWLEEEPLHRYSETQMQKIRGKRIGMIFQDPALALNPVMTIGEQLAEAFTKDQKSYSGHQLHKAMVHLLEQVRIPDPKHCLKQYPHQLSGGMKQRVVIAIALSNSPDLLIADEPTTNLDVTTQAQVLQLIQELNHDRKMGIILITHDFGIVAEMADRVAVMYAGHLLETCTKEEFLRAPKHPYTQKLFQALPDHAQDRPLATLPGQVPLLNQIFHLCRFKSRCAVQFKPCESVTPRLTAVTPEHNVRCHWYDPNIMATLPIKLRLTALNAVGSNPAMAETLSEPYQPSEEKILSVKDLKVHFPIQRGIFKKTVGSVKAVDGVSFNIYEGHTLALVGESGCGKTTAAKAIMRLIDEGKGTVEFHDKNILTMSSRQLKKIRNDLQMIFQDPFSSMDPRFTILDVIEEGMKALKIGTDRAERQDRILHALSSVGLQPYILQRYPHQLSGGQRQRVAIARALAVGAHLIVCDEPTSALDLSVQAQILNLLKTLQEELDVSYLFITHNISVVQYLAHDVAIMYLGRIVEMGPAKSVIADPKHPYTKALMSAVPSLLGKKIPMVIKGEVPSPSNPPKGCHFSPRCPDVHARCLESYPPAYPIEGDRWVKCYLFDPDHPDHSDQRIDQAASTMEVHSTDRHDH